MSAATRKWEKRARAVLSGKRKRETFSKQDKLASAIKRVTQ